MFNDYFSRQCRTIDSNSSLPPNITFETEQKLPIFDFCADDIIKIIKLLDSNKADRHDEISAAKPFKNCFENEYFHKEYIPI